MNKNYTCIFCFDKMSHPLHSLHEFRCYNITCKVLHYPRFKINTAINSIAYREPTEFSYKKYLIRSADTYIHDGPSEFKKLDIGFDLGLDLNNLTKNSFEKFINKLDNLLIFN